MRGKIWANNSTIAESILPKEQILYRNNTIAFYFAPFKRTKLETYFHPQKNE